MNLQILTILKLAQFFNPLFVFAEQLHSVCDFDCLDETKYVSRIELIDVMPWCDASNTLYHQIQAINGLEMDHQTLLLAMVISLLHHPQNKAEIKSIQNDMRLILYKYLCSKMSQHAAQWKFERIECVLNTVLASNDCIILQK